MCVCVCVRVCVLQACGNINGNEIMVCDVIHKLVHKRNSTTTHLKVFKVVCELARNDGGSVRVAIVPVG